MRSRSTTPMRGPSSVATPVTATLFLIAAIGFVAGCQPAPEGERGPDAPPADAATAEPAAAGRQASPGRQTAAGGVEVEYLSSADSALASLPFSEAVRVGNLLFLSGQIGTVPGEGRLVGGGIGPETRQTMENIRAALERHGSSLERVVKCTAMLADIAEWEAMNEVYVTFFPEGRRPARSAFGTSGLALGARVEIECIAATGRV